MKKSLKIIGLVLALVVIVGGEIYLLVQSKTNKTNEVNTEETQVQQKSLVEYYQTKDQFLDNKLKQDPSEIGFKEISKVKAACPANTDGPCGFDLLILSKTELQEGNQEFYLAEAGGAGYSYYGPFTDNLERLIDERKTIETLE